MKGTIEVMHDFLGKMILASSIDEIHESIFSVVKKILDFAECTLYVMYGQSLKVAYPKGYRDSKSLSLNGADDDDMLSKSVRTKIIVCDPYEIAAPIVVDDAVIGVIDVKNKTGKFDDDDGHLLEVLLGMTAASVKNFESKMKMVQSENKCRTMIKNAVEGIYRSTIDGQILEANLSLVKFFGYENEGELRKAGIFKTYKNPEERRKFVEALLKEKKVKNYGIEYRKKNGETVMGNEFAILVDGDTIIEGIIHDVTELKKAEKKAKFYNSLIRHDIWNKNQIVMGYLELLSDTELSGEQRSFLERAKLAVKSNTGLMEEVNKLRHMEEHQNVKEIDIDEMMRAVLNQLLHEAERRKISIRYTPSGIKINTVTIINEVFYNILLNAILHAHCKNIRIYVISNKKFCKITIEDDGVGIGPEIKKDIFKRTVRGGRENGMGLYLTGKIVEMNGGHIKVKNRIKEDYRKGTVFEIYLPMENNFKR